jgi:hypothetical protein
VGPRQSVTTTRSAKALSHPIADLKVVYPFRATA